MLHQILLMRYTSVLRSLCVGLHELGWVLDSSTHFYFIRSHSLCSISKATNLSSFTLDYLVNSCGLSRESALKASQRIVIKNTTRSDSVLALFSNYGFTKTQISKLIARNPRLILAKPEKTLKPKLEFLSEIGISGPNLAKIIGDSNILRISLERAIIPSLNFLRIFLTTDGDIALTLSRLKWNNALREIMGPNIETLRNHGLPDSSISKLLLLQPRLLAFKVDHFEEMVLRTKELGIDPLSLMFVHGLRTVSSLSKPKWEMKLSNFRSFGWSEDEITSLFRKQPSCLSRSVEQMSTRLDFFMNRLNWTVADILKNPILLLLSFEKRIVRRLSILQILINDGLLKKTNIPPGLMMTEAQFLDKFVMQYQKELPQLLKL
ncbi:hypothetical protein NE237_002907 [Protea cynaroides]|uniref:Uncharacterized protein n=1 Tax=Protea cynaroides TaxID=273540 RepID=A0A9Q0QS31_9MAGN|nr:hypothetical protein NE237_002907 [Protea cynaroides]